MDRQPELFTHHVAIDQAVASLSHEEMLALAARFERWALDAEGISPEQRTMLILWSADYERIAEFVGPDWQPPDGGGAIDAMSFLAGLERAAT